MFESHLQTGVGIQDVLTHEVNVANANQSDMQIRSTGMWNSSIRANKDKTEMSLKRLACISII